MSFDVETIEEHNNRRLALECAMRVVLHGREGHDVSTMRSDILTLANEFWNFLRDGE